MCRHGDLGVARPPRCLSLFGHGTDAGQPFLPRAFDGPIYTDGSANGYGPEFVPAGFAALQVDRDALPIKARTGRVPK